MKKTFNSMIRAVLFATLLLLAAMLLSAPLQAQDVAGDENVKSPGAKVNGVATDMIQLEVVGILGKPAETENTVLGLCWHYKNPAISVYFKKKGTVDQITTKDPKAVIEFKGKKFKVGDKLEDVRKLLGKPDLEEGTGKYKELYYDLASFVIYFTEGKVSRVNIQSKL